MELHTSRLKLRLIEFSDLEAIHQLHSIPEVDEFNTLGIPENIEQTATLIESWLLANEQQEVTSYTFAIETISNKVFIGLLGLKLWPKKNRRAEVWYKLQPDHWGKGYATEAVNSILDFGFNKLNLHRIQAGCAVANIGSIKVLEKVGMIKEGKCRQVLLLKSGWSDNYEYAILETDYELLKK
ncbi:GNAT family N-acetyltransferase [Flavobacterium sp. PL002]|uniref:GNAT family N-acetyltransferase n=1 Tax=Flavobacterium sp. PL002 TaxID=1897058 RepID=UPI001787C8B4|nr:GNAT family N-acetyltransferase [Flavobacterium sp. PL002]MBE0390824.1 Spermidine N(1)-acetyltransferase [Flavobacterium sp. PL002]